MKLKLDKDILSEFIGYDIPDKLPRKLKKQMKKTIVKKVEYALKNNDIQKTLS